MIREYVSNRIVRINHYAEGNQVYVDGYLIAWGAPYGTGKATLAQRILEEVLGKQTAARYAKRFTIEIIDSLDFNDDFKLKFYIDNWLKTKQWLYATTM